MNPQYAIIIAVVIATVLIVIATRRAYSWPRYAVAAIILGCCAYTYLQPEYLFADWGASWVEFIAQNGVVQAVRLRNNPPNN